MRVSVAAARLIWRLFNCYCSLHPLGVLAAALWLGLVPNALCAPGRQLAVPVNEVHQSGAFLEATKFGVQYLALNVDYQADRLTKVSIRIPSMPGPIERSSTAVEDARCGANCYALHFAGVSPLQGHVKFAPDSKTGWLTLEGSGLPFEIDRQRLTRIFSYRSTSKEGVRYGHRSVNVLDAPALPETLDYAYEFPYFDLDEPCENGGCSLLLRVVERFGSTLILREGDVQTQDAHASGATPVGARYFQYEVKKGAALRRLSIFDLVSTSKACQERVSALAEEGLVEANRLFDLHALRRATARALPASWTLGGGKFFVDQAGLTIIWDPTPSDARPFHLTLSPQQLGGCLNISE